MSIYIKLSLAKAVCSEKTFTVHLQRDEKYIHIQWKKARASKPSQNSSNYHIMDNLNPPIKKQLLKQKEISSVGINYTKYIQQK